MGNPFTHVELSTTDVNKAKEFYGKLLEWELQDMDMGGSMTYTMIKVGKGTGGGIMKQMIPGAPSAWMPYIEVENLQDSTNRAKTLGAKVMKEPTEVMDAGSFSILTDPTGAVIGLWESKAKK